VVSTLPGTVVSGATFRWSPPAWDSDSGFPTAIAWAAPKLWLFRKDLFWASVDDLPEDLTVNLNDDSAIVGRLRSPDGARWSTCNGRCRPAR
jgi:hypothetical protein